MTSELRAAIESLPLSEECQSDSALLDVVRVLSQDERWQASYERCCALDRRIAAVVHDVPLPDGLAHLVANAVSSATARAPVAPVAAPSTSTELGGGAAQAWSRRWWLLVGSAAIVASIALLTMTFTQWITEPVWNAGQLAEVAAHFCLSDDAAVAELRTDFPPNDYPFGRGVVSPSVIRWRLVSDFLGRTAVAYELPSIGGHRARLYVARVNLSNSIDTPPQHPDFSTGRCAVAVWQRGGVAYLLVVIGDQPVSAYPWFLERPTSPIT